MPKRDKRSPISEPLRPEAVFPMMSQIACSWASLKEGIEGIYTASLFQ